ncbi:hypothetical protein G4B88_000718 [Cannabis sativa]|uniref:Uncharacterized protein n=1 Tax=Cannabis sativa TaxID=3483 RepID=A0A7J6DQV9_CANSA|nr:hypothetical protein G4B88_000718 [Cannabis sativa]
MSWHFTLLPKTKTHYGLGVARCGIAEPSGKPAPFGEKTKYKDGLFEKGFISLFARKMGKFAAKEKKTERESSKGFWDYDYDSFVDVSKRVMQGRSRLQKEAFLSALNTRLFLIFQVIPHSPPLNLTLMRDRLSNTMHPQPLSPPPNLLNSPYFVLPFFAEVEQSRTYCLRCRSSPKSNRAEREGSNRAEREGETEIDFRVDTESCRSSAKSNKGKEQFRVDTAAL